MDRTRLNKAELIFNDLADLARDSRAANLDIRCAGDGELRSLVEHLLANDDSGMGDFLQMGRPNGPENIRPASAG